MLVLALVLTVLVVAQIVVNSNEAYNANGISDFIDNDCLSGTDNICIMHGKFAGPYANTNIHGSVIVLLIVAALVVVWFVNGYDASDIIGSIGDSGSGS